MVSSVAWWAIYDVESNKPIFKSNDYRSLDKLVNELKLALGDKFFLEEYKEKNEGIS